MPMYLGTRKLKGGNGLVRAYVGTNKVYDAYTYVTRTENQTIPFSTTTRSSANLLKYESRVATQGKNGTRRITYQDTYKYGVKVSTKKVKEEVIASPVNKVIENGTKTTFNDSLLATKVDYYAINRQAKNSAARYTVKKENGIPAVWNGKRGYFTTKTTVTAYENPRDNYEIWGTNVTYDDQSDTMTLNTQNIPTELEMIRLSSVKYAVRFELREHHCFTLHVL